MIRYFYDIDTTAVNRSWICLNNNSNTCEFITGQQFHRQWQYAGLIEGSILITISLLAIPCNILAIYNYSRKQMNKELLVLIYALCCYNFLSVPFIITGGIARMVDNFPMGEFGCFLTMPFASAVINSTTFTLALISYERRQILTNFEYSQNKGSGLRKIGLLLALINCFSFTTYPLIFYKLFQVVTIIKYPIYGNNEPLVDICFTQADKFGFPLDAFFVLLNLIIPLSITGYNYFSIWRYSTRLKARTVTFKRAYQTNAFFARLMIASVAEFVICQLPFGISLSVAAMLKMRGGDLHLNSTAAFVSFIFAFTDCIINPLWFSFITMKKAKDGSMSKIGLRLISIKSSPNVLLSSLTDNETAKS